MKSLKKFSPYTCFYLGLLLLFYGCSNFPSDPEQTLENAKNDTLKVGVMENPPFTVKEGKEYKGAEAEMVTAFARANGATVKWVEGTEEELFKKLENYELAIVIGGLTSKSPRKKQSGFTQPYFKKSGEKYVLATAPGENALTLSLEKFIQNYHNE